MQNNSFDSTRRITMFVPTLHGGGAERVMVNLAIAFYERGIHVDLVLLKPEGPFLLELPPGVRIIDLKASRLLTGFFALLRYLRRERPQVVLSAMIQANVVMLLAARLTRFNGHVVVCEHSTASAFFKQTPGFKTSILRVMMGMLYPCAFRIVAVSNGVAADLGNLLHLDKKHFSVIPNPIVSGKIFLLSEEPVSHPWIAYKSPPVILAVGRLTPAKDFGVLLQAFAKARQLRQLRLLILGEGELRSDLEALIEKLGLTEDVALPGFADNPFAYMRQADLFVLSSRWEGFGNVLVEAMACGVPVISTDCPSGPSEILEGGKWGKLVPVGDADALAQAMLDMLANPYPSAVQRAMDFSIENAADRYLQVLYS